jgi:hypothetical protein
VQSFVEQPVQVAPQLSPSQHQLIHLAEANYQEKQFTDGQRIKTLVAQICFTIYSWSRSISFYILA